MNYDEWTKIGTVIPSLRILIAPEVFIPKENILLSDEKIVLAGTKYFSWHTAKKLVDEKKVPAGYRLMSLKEAKFLKEFYNKSRFGLLVLGLDGLINPNDMPIYKNIPTGYDDCIRYVGSMGGYWLDDLEAPLYPRVISVNSSEIQVGSMYGS